MLQLLFIVYLRSTFDHSLCRQKSVFVALSLGQLPLATKYISGSLPGGPRGSELREQLPSPSAAVQHGVGHKPTTHAGV